MKKWIVKTLKRWLGLTVMDTQIERQESRIQDLDNQVNSLNRIKSHIDVGADVGYKGNESWAVICIKGKPESVRFIDLRGVDERQLVMFLRDFEKRNMTLDLPPMLTSLKHRF